ncbi:MAG: hypothetical protein JNN11_05280 [Candidatus Doudnabacteria bacterium]|nr:hypothetical protein [Candidatus Doudnabacteria bacterium]
MSLKMHIKNIFAKQKKLGALFFAFALLLASFPSGSGAQVTYAPVVLTSPSNLSLNVQIQALGYSSGKWSYKVSWRRTLDLRGSIYVSPKSDKNTKVSMSPSGSDITRIGESTLQLDPSLRYRIEYYSETNGGGRLLLRKFFDTLPALGTTATTNPGAGTTTITPQSSTGTTQVPVSTTPATEPVPVYMNLNANDMGFNGGQNMPDPILVKKDDITVKDLTISNKEGLTQDQINQIRYQNKTLPKNPRTITAYASVGREFVAPFGYYIPFDQSCENNPKFKIEVVKESSVPGLTFRKGPDKSETYYEKGACTYGALKGITTSAGTYQFEYKMTSNFGSSQVITTTKLNIVVMNTNVYPVTLGDFYQPNGQAATGPVLGGRATIYWNQSGGTYGGQGAHSFNEMEIWAVPADRGGINKHPTLTSVAQSAKRIGIVSMSTQNCNNSTRGGGDGYAYGCGSFSWIVGNTLSGNLASGSYIIYVLPYVDPANQQDKLGGGGIIEAIFLSTQYSAYDYGAGQVTIAPTPAGQTSLLNNSSAVSNYGNFDQSKSGIFYTRKNSSGNTISTGQVGVGWGSNSDQASCNGTTLGVACGVTINANPGDVLDLSWAAKDPQGQNVGQSWESKAQVLGSYDYGNEAVVRQVKECTNILVPGGLSSNPSDGFMSSPQGSKSFTVPNCLAGKSLYLSYDVWFSTFGGSAASGGLRPSGLLVINIGTSQTVGEITNWSCRLPAVISNPRCEKVSGGYKAVWDQFGPNSIPAKVEFQAGENKSQVESGCQSGTSCIKPQEVRWTNGDPADANSPFNVNGIQNNKTYWNKLEVSCGSGGSEETRQAVWSCSVDSSGNVTASASNDPYNNANCQLPSEADIYGVVAPSCTLGYDITGKLDVSLRTKAYISTFQDIRRVGAKFDSVTYLADKDQQKVISGCATNVGASGGCLVWREVNLNATTPDRITDPNRFNEQYVGKNSKDATPDLQANTVYWNRLIYRCGQNYREVMWSCATER